MKYNQFKPLFGEIAGGFPFAGKPLGVVARGVGLGCCVGALCCLDGWVSGCYLVLIRCWQCGFGCQVLGFPKFGEGRKVVVI
jgi:hypothetical protein